MSEWPRARLGELCTVIAGGTPPRANPENFGGEVPWVKIGDMLQGCVKHTEEMLSTQGVKNSAAKVLPAGTVLISIFATIGRTAILGVDAATNQAIAGVVPKDPKELSATYLRRYLDSAVAALVARAQGVAQININSSILKSIIVPIPTLPEQQRITDILDQVDALRAKRREAIALLDDLARSIFLDMFGDPLVNGRGWERLPLGRLVSRIESGKSPQCLDRSARDQEWGVLKLGAVTQGIYVPSENKALPETATPDLKIEVRPGDLLFTRKNTPELVAATAYVFDTPERLLLPDLIFRFAITADAAIDKIYLHGLLSYPPKRRKIQELATGSAASMPNISKAKLLDLLCEVPPLGLQQRYASRVLRIEKLKASHRTHLAQLDALFASLQHRAFTGTLFPADSAA